MTLMLLCCCSLVQSQAVEAYFNGTSWLTLNSNSSAFQATNLYQIGLSFRTCGPRGFGVLFSQVSSSQTNKQPSSPFGRWVVVNLGCDDA